MSIGRIIQLLRNDSFEEEYGELVNLSERGDFVLLNYNNRCQYESAWDEVTRVCRGLIVDRSNWRVAALPLPKFFNIGEREETKPENLPKLPFRAYEKMDGSLGTLWRDRDGIPRLATRGSFESEQALRGTEFLQKLPNLDKVPDECTLIFEIIYRDNLNVVPYDFEGLVLLAIMDRRDLWEAPFEVVRKTADMLEVPVPKVYSFSSVEEACENARNLPYTEEGYVVRYNNGMRVKLKSPAYLEVHKAVHDFSEKRVLESLVEGGYDELLMAVPEEYRIIAEELGEKVFAEANELEGRVTALFNKAPKATRKEYALWVKREASPELLGALFSLLDGREINWISLAAGLRLHS